SIFLSTIRPPPTSTLFPYTTLFRSLRGDVLGASNQNEEALRSYDEALRQRDGDAAAWTSRAELLRKTGRSIDAVSAYDRAIGLTDRKSTRLNSSHVAISYAVFCLKK